MESELSGQERAMLVRSLLGSRGWDMYDKDFLAVKWDQVRDQGYLQDSERHPDFQGWSIDRIGGMVMGIGWARIVLREWLKRYEAAQRPQPEEPEENGNGHPYVDDRDNIAADATTKS